MMGQTIDEVDWLKTAQHFKLSQFYQFYDDLCELILWCCLTQGGQSVISGRTINLINVNK
jgi:hypothetical protein